MEGGWVGGGGVTDRVCDGKHCLAAVSSSTIKSFTIRGDMLGHSN